MGRFTVLCGVLAFAAAAFGQELEAGKTIEGFLTNARIAEPTRDDRDGYMFPGPEELDFVWSDEPLVVHIHASEYDRSGENVNARVRDLEQFGLSVADRVIMLHDSTRGIIAEGDPKYLRDHSRNPFVKQFFNRLPDETAAANRKDG